MARCLLLCLALVGVSQAFRTRRSNSMYGQCSSYGCYTPYNRSRSCQCNSRCERYRNCCSDFWSRCKYGSPSPSPPSPPSRPSPPPPSPPSPPPAGTAPPAPPPSSGGAEAYWSGVNMQSLSAIKSKISNAIKLRYTPQVWNAYKTIWVDLPGKCAGRIFDVYSAKCWQPGVEQCGGFRREGDCYNREHSWPKSWWGGSGSTPAYTDLFHLFPSDGYVNSKRSALPFGEVGSAKYTSSEGNKVGSCSAGTCFEPIDAIKGLMARGHLYMVTRYGFSSKGQSTQLMLKWHDQFPPESWELEMNDRIQKVQRNRNPYIDYPELARSLLR